MAGSRFVFNQPKVLIAANFVAPDRLINFTEFKDDAHIRGSVTSDVDGGCTKDIGKNGPTPFCSSVYGGYDIYTLELHNNFKKVELIATEKIWDQKYFFSISSREVVNKATIDTQAIFSGDVVSTFSVNSSKCLKYLGGDASNKVTIHSTDFPLIDNSQINNIDLKFGDGNDFLDLTKFQGPNKTLKKLNASFGDGDNVININSGAHDPVFFSQRVKIKTGAGNDKINPIINGGLLAAKKVVIKLGRGEDSINFGIAASIARKVKSVVVDLGKDSVKDFAKIYVPKSFDQSLIRFKNETDVDSATIWTWSPDHYSALNF